MRRHPVLVLALLVFSVCVIVIPAGRVNGSVKADLTPYGYVHLPAVFAAPPPTDTPTLTPSPTPTSALTPGPTPTPTPTQDPGQIEWDPRLDLRHAEIIPADVQPGQWYWRLAKGVWYAENEAPFAGQHHIFVDTRDAAGHRQPGVPLDVRSTHDGALFATIVTEQKPGDLYAANFPMYAVAPAYRVVPSDGNPADAVTGLGLGSIELPDWSIHTSYGFIWEWSEAPDATLQPSAADAAGRPLVVPAQPWRWPGFDRELY